jgi:hypothetical protein
MLIDGLGSDADAAVVALREAVGTGANPVGNVGSCRTRSNAFEVGWSTAKAREKPGRLS